MCRWQRVFLVLSGAVPLLGLLGHPPDTGLLVYACFVLALFLRPRFAAAADRLPGSANLRLLGAFFISGMLTETFAWLNNYLKAAETPALFHPQLFVDLLIGVGFYGGWAAAWIITLRWFRFKLWEAFVITGLQGIFFEQLGAVFLAMVRALPANPLLSLLLGAYVFAVHGSVVGLAMVPVIERFAQPARSRHWVRFPVVAALMVGLAFAGCWLVGVLALPFGGLPPKRSILEHPLW
jgi:hypothetical protein